MRRSMLGKKWLEYMKKRHEVGVEKARKREWLNEALDVWSNREWLVRHSNTIYFFPGVSAGRYRRRTQDLFIY